MASLKFFSSGVKFFSDAPKLGEVLYSARPKSEFSGRIKFQPNKFTQRNTYRFTDFGNLKDGIMREKKFFISNPLSNQFNTSFHAVHMEVEAQSDGLIYKLSVPMPTEAKCLFVTSGEQSVDSFLNELRKEDSSISKAALYAGDTRISGSSMLKHAIRSGFSLEINGNRFDVPAAKGAEQALSHTLPMTEKQRSTLESLKSEIWPLLTQKFELDRRAVKYANFVIYAGFGYLVGQWLFLARLTWWEFNWDVMEPVTYFITFGTAILGYTYFMFSKREYTFEDLRGSIVARRMKKLYQKTNFNLEHYKALEERIKELNPNAFNELLEKAQSKNPATA